jgi:hypothetical protein
VGIRQDRILEVDRIRPDIQGDTRLSIFDTPPDHRPAAYSEPVIIIQLNETGFTCTRP